MQTSKSFSTSSPGDEEILNHNTITMPPPRQSGPHLPSKQSGCRPPSRKRLSPVFTAAFAPHRHPPSQLLSPAIAVAITAAAFTCCCLLWQLQSHFTAAITSCRLSLSSAPPNHRVIAANIVTVSLLPPPALVACRAFHHPLLPPPSLMLLPSRVPELPAYRVPTTTTAKMFCATLYCKYEFTRSFVFSILQLNCYLAAT